MMDIAQLRDVQSRERTTDSLQELPESFYADVASYIAELKAERERAAEDAEDPFADPDVNRLTDEIQTAEQVAESLYERRVGKIVKQASFAAAGMGGADDGLTAEEQDLYDDLVGRIEENKGRVLDVLAGEGDDADASEEETESAPEERADAAALMGEGETEPADGVADAAADAPTRGGRETGNESTPEPPEPSSDAAEAIPNDDAPADGAPTPTAESGSAGDDSEDSRPESEDEAATDAGPAEKRETVRITQDVGEIFGVDERTYTLESEDVVSLPEVNAGALVDRDAATRLE